MWGPKETQAISYNWANTDKSIIQLIRQEKKIVKSDGIGQITQLQKIMKYNAITEYGARVLAVPDSSPSWINDNLEF